jgi:N-acetylglucosaminyl-diphospho-decaprenol L-rhamnosyltransferase
MISILIVHYNRPDLLTECLGSLSDAEDVVVVDNGSLNNASRVALSEKFPEVTWVFLEENLGFSAGVNRAAASARGDVLFLLNPDTSLEGVSITKLEQEFRDEGADIMGLEQVDSHGQVQLSIGWSAGIVPELFRKMLQDGWDKEKKWAYWLLDKVQRPASSVDWVAGSALLTHKSVFDALNGFDERYFLYFEDIDYCLRAAASGARIAFSNSTRLIHHRGACASTAPVASKNHYRNSQRLFFSEHGTKLAKMLMPAWSDLRKRVRRT